MIVSELTLTLFRSHRRLARGFDGRPVAIFGPNGAGKTNLLEAVSLLSPGRGLRRAEKGALALRPDGLGWKITATAAATDAPENSGAGPAETEPGTRIERRIETWAETDQPRQVAIDGKPAPQSALGRVLRMLWLTPAMDRVWIESAEGRRRLLDRIALSFHADHADAAIAYERAMRERNRLLNDMVRDPHWYQALEAQMAEAATTITRNRLHALARITEASEAADTAFPAAQLTLLTPEGPPEAVTDLAASLAAWRARDMAAGRTLTGPHRAELVAIWAARGMPAAQCSTGEQKALLVSLILANARALCEDLGAAPVLLLDEVAAHLDRARRAHLYDEIVALGAQAFLTGTDRQLFAALEGRADFLEMRGMPPDAPRDPA